MASTVLPNHSVDKNPFMYSDYSHISRLRWTSMDPISLSNTKTGENLPQQIIAAELAGN